MNRELYQKILEALVHGDFERAEKLDQEYAYISWLDEIKYKSNRGIDKRNLERWK